MLFKGLLLDLDNTLYDYETAHQAAICVCVQFLKSFSSLSEEEFLLAYHDARGHINEKLAGTASSHNRLLYFQRLLEEKGVKLFPYALDLYKMYWSVFLENIKLFDGVDELLSLCPKDKICIVTDLTADVQHQKILSMKLEDRIACLVTSEEVGQEKPHPEIFKTALLKIKCASGEACMIGDNYEKDICGAESIGIKSFWLNRNLNEKDSNECQSYSSLSEIVKAIQLCK